ncbi:MAG TPA: metallophosphoesterase [Tepidisphaeraceae bacterium]|jgi:hypothetical protein|nr:metallophosphoesterase [Tepidisphaeraceae bacterium]
MLMNADHVIETFGAAAEENQVSPLREHQVVNLPGEGEVWIAGDLHDHRRNFEKLIRAADLANNPQRHLVLQELIHGDHFDAQGAEESWKILAQAAELKADQPGQVHFLLANHDLAQVHGEGIMKAGQSVCEAFTAGVKRDFGERSALVNAAIADFLLSFPLAVRAPNGLFFCHSLPTDQEMLDFDFGVFDRALTGADYRRRTGPVYQLIWGRKTSPESAETFADKVGAQLLITGHQPQEAGYLVNGNRHLIIASEHNQGVMLALSLSDPYDMDGLLASMHKFVSIAA